MVDVPPATPVTTPVVAPTVATAVLPLVHVYEVPVAVELLNVVVVLEQSVPVPVIAPAKGYAHIITLPLPHEVFAPSVVNAIRPEPPI